MKNANPTWGGMLGEIVSVTGVVLVAGPPIVLLLGPWLLFVLMLAGPFAVLVTLVVLFIAAMALVALVLATLASPYLLVGHLLRYRRERRVAVQASTGVASPRLLPTESRRAAA
jgi:hypothetical protein